MGKLNQGEAIRQALLARGERRIDSSNLSRVERWTRTYYIKRDADGGLVEMPKAMQSPAKFLYVARYAPVVRIGRLSTASRLMNKELVDILIEEGRKLAVGEVPSRL